MWFRDPCPLHKNKEVKDLGGSPHPARWYTLTWVDQISPHEQKRNEMEITILVIQYLTVFLNHQNNYLNLWWKLNYSLGFSGGSDGKESACNAGDLSSIPESGKIPGEGNRNPLQYSCLENPWTEEPGGLQSMELQRVRHNWATNTFTSNYSLAAALGLDLKIILHGEGVSHPHTLTATPHFWAVYV